MRRIYVFGLIWALFCMAAFMPARWAGALLPGSVKSEIIPGSIHGTIWRGNAKVLLPKTSWPLNVSYKLNPISALFRRPFAQSQLSGYGFNANGKLGVFSRRNFTAKNFKADFDIAQLPISDPRFSGLSGQAFVTLDALNMKKECRAAEGNIRTNILSRNVDTLLWSGPILSGPISCDGDALVANLRGSDNDYDIALELRLSPDGLYGLDMSVTPKGPPSAEFQVALLLLGFEDNPDGSAVLKERGQLFQGSRNPNER